MALKYNWEWEQKHSVKSSINQSNYINELIAGMKVDGNWTKLDRLAILATEQQAQAKVYLNSPSSTAISEVNSPTFTAKRGFTGNGSSSYLNANYTPSSGTKLLQDDACAGVYCRTNSLATVTDLGSISASPTIRLYLQIRRTNTTDDWWISGMNANTDNSGVKITNTNSAGFHTIVRTVSTEFTSQRNGSSLGTSTVTSNGRPSVTMYICALNNNGTAAGFSARQIAAALMGAGSINQSNLNTRITNYMTRIGAQV
jgi:hypothetical protein